jgi:hypothetical protein
MASTPRKATISGKNCANRLDSSNNFQPTDGVGTFIIFSSSPIIRSFEIILSREAVETMPSNVVF